MRDRLLGCPILRKKDGEGLLPGCWGGEWGMDAPGQRDWLALN